MKYRSQLHHYIALVIHRAGIVHASISVYARHESVESIEPRKRRGEGRHVLQLQVMSVM